MVGAGLLGIIGLGVLAGLLIGCVGIGGVILVPALAYGFGVPIHTSIPAASAAYLVAGAIGTFAYARAGSVPWVMARPLFAAAMPAALIGALASGATPAGLLEACIGALTMLSGLNAWRGRPDATAAGRAPSTAQLTIAGAATGFASALTGTGGPLVLVPILMWLDCPVLAAVGMAQVIQLPIALTATAGNLWAGAVDWTLASALALGLAGGTVGGAKIAHAVPQATLRRIVAAVLAIVGVAILVKVGAQRLV